MAGEKELQEKLLAYRIIESRLDNFMGQRDAMMNRILEIETTLSSLKEMGKENITFSLGSGAHAFGKIENRDKIIVEIGAGIAVEKTAKEAEEILSKRKDEMENALKELQRGIMQLSTGLENLAPEIQDLINKTKEKVG
jgi:prefoldin alpha subunit